MIPHPPWLGSGLRVLIATIVVGGLYAVFLASTPAKPRVAPEFPTLAPSSWSGPPTSLASQRGKVVLLNVWTFGCINCARTLPWVRSVWERDKDRGLSVIGVHSPEFDRERDPKEVEKARNENGLGYPSFIDNDQIYWRALDNHYWPAIYILDKTGRIRNLRIGEVHQGDRAATELEALIESLMKEPDTPSAKSADPIR